MACSPAGNGCNTSKNSLHPKPSSKIDCKAKVNATACPDGKYRLSNVVLDHNHELSPGKACFYKSNKKLDPQVKRRLELNDQAGMKVSKNFLSLVVQAGGYENLKFGEKDCRNFLDKARRLRLGPGDAEAIHKYYLRMQTKNTNFLYSMDLDDKGRLINVFWTDARSRAAYESFWMSLPSTRRTTNKYDMPFAPFVGVNHHGQSILLGCELVCKEDIDTFVWLFQSWLSCISGRAPVATITDQYKAMQRAIEIGFPATHHRWCIWHIMKKIPEKLRGFHEY